MLSQAPPSTAAHLELFNNLLTKNQGNGLRFQALGGDAHLDGGANGYHANGNGHVAGVPLFASDLIADPRYASAADLRLRQGSPMLDSGDDGVASDLVHDRLRQARHQGKAVDRGAYEGTVRVE